MPKLSIITINLNNREGLEKTIKSVVNQTFKDYEYIVVDGNSTDGSVEIIGKYEDKIYFSISERDTGVYNAMNKGIHHARGEYCLFLNSGDYLYSENTLAEVFSKERKEDIVYGNMIIEYASGKKELGKMPDQITMEHMIKDTLWHPVSFIKRDIFERFGLYREDLKITADYDFFLKNIFINKVITCHIPVPIAVFLLGGMSSHPSNTEILKSEREKVQLQYFDKEMMQSIQKKIKNEMEEELTRKNSLKKKISRWFRS